MEEVHEQIGDMRLEGFLSLDGSPSKTYQYFCACSTDIDADVLPAYCRKDINKHLMSTCDLHRIIESKFSRSSFAKHVRTSLICDDDQTDKLAMDRLTRRMGKPAGRDLVRSSGIAISYIHTNH